MMRKTIALALLLMLALSALALPLGAAKDYRAERFDATWQVDSDGSMLVTETVVFRFDGGPFTFVYRELPEDYSDGVEIMDVRLDGAPLAQGEGAGAYEVEDDDPLTVTWHFPPTSDATRVFELSYLVRGAVRREGGEDLLTWNFLPTDYEYPIDAATLRVLYPATAQRTGAAEVRRGQAVVTEGDGEARFEAANVPAGEPLTVALRFAEGSLISGPPAWQVRQQQVAERAPLTALAAGLAFLLGGGWLVALWRRGRRDAAFTPAQESMTYSPPSDLAPALAGALANGSGKAGAAQALATVFSLAQRGLLTIEQTGEKKLWGEPPYAFRKTAALSGAKLSAHEAALVDVLFTDKHGAQDEVTLQKAGQRLQSKLAPFTKAVEEELTAQGHMDPTRRKYVSRFWIAGGALLALSVVAALAGAFLVRWLGGWIFLLPLALFMLSMAGFIMGASYSALSERGEDAAARWRGFRSHIKSVTKGREPSWDTRMFDRYFPYAASFDMAEGWAKAFQKAGGTEVPAWFRSLAVSPDGGVAAIVVMTTAMRSSTASAGGAGSGGAGGGGGSGAG